MIIIACLFASFVLWKVIPHYWRRHQDKKRWIAFREEQARIRAESNAKAYAHLDEVLRQERLKK